MSFKAPLTEQQAANAVRLAMDTTEALTEQVRELRNENSRLGEEIVALHNDYRTRIHILEDRVLSLRVGKDA